MPRRWRASEVSPASLTALSARRLTPHGSIQLFLDAEPCQSMSLHCLRNAVRTPTYAQASDAGDAKQYMDALTNLFSLIGQGGWVMLPLGFCSILAAAIVIERLIWGPSRRNLFPATFLETVDELLSKSRFEELLGVCRHQQHALARILSTALLFSSRPRSEMLSHVEVAGQKEAARITRRLGVLGTIAAICPLLGLLGTVFGMITTFEVIQSEGVGNANALAGGIAEALITTAAGLSIAIPSLVFYRAFMHHAKELIAELEQRISLLLERIPTESGSTEGV